MLFKKNERVLIVYENDVGYGGGWLNSMSKIGDIMRDLGIHAKIKTNREYPDMAVLIYYADLIQHEYIKKIIKNYKNKTGKSLFTIDDLT